MWQMSWLIWIIGISAASARRNRPVESKSYILSITAIQSLGDVYIDGAKLALLNAKNWSVTDHMTVPSMSRLIAVEGLVADSDQCAGILASINDTYLLTDSSWKCSTNGYDGWMELGFDDSSWLPAAEYGNNGNHANCIQQLQFPDISSNAKWIWSDPPIDFDVYCRGYLPLCTTASPCMNGGTCLRNDKKICDCSPEYTGQFCETELMDGTLFITAFQRLQTVYIDGVNESLINGNMWNQTDRLALSATNRLIAVSAIGDGVCGGILASFGDSYVLTNAQWRCSRYQSTGWYNLGFDDESEYWLPAKEYGTNWDGHSGCSLQVVTDISLDASWIWVDQLTEQNIFCRGYTPMCDNSPCLNNGTCLQNEINICQCPSKYTGMFCENEIVTPSKPPTTVKTTTSEQTTIPQTTEGATTTILQTTEATTVPQTTPGTTTSEVTTEGQQTTQSITTENVQTTQQTTVAVTTNGVTTENLPTTQETTTTAASTTASSTSSIPTTPVLSTTATTDLPSTPTITTPSSPSATTVPPSTSTATPPQSTTPTTPPQATTTPNSQPTTTVPPTASTTLFTGIVSSTLSGNFVSTDPAQLLPICTTDHYCNGPFEKPGASIKECACPADFLNVNDNCCMNQNWIIGLTCLSVGILLIIFIIIIICLCRSDDSDSSFGDELSLVERENLADARSVDLAFVSETKVDGHGKPEGGVVDAHHVAGAGLHSANDGHLAAAAALHSANDGHLAAAAALHAANDGHRGAQSRRPSLGSLGNTLRGINPEHPLTTHPIYTLGRRRGQPAYRSMIERGRREDFFYNPLMVELLSNDIYRHFRPSLAAIPTNVDYSIQRPEIELEFLYNELYGSDLHRGSGGFYDYSSPWNNMNMNMRL